MPLTRTLIAALLDLAAPEACALCGAQAGERPWCGRGPAAPGLRALDAPHLCLPCRDKLVGEPVELVPAAASLPVIAARATVADLVTVVAAWKYHGIRGLAWPLAELLEPAARRLGERTGQAPLLVPVPLHGRRRRERGFNQAELLARLLAVRLGWTCSDLLRRVRATEQQARLAGDDARRRNLDGCCRVSGDAGDAPSGPLVLVDDIVTSGATLGEAARARAAAGRPPVAALALGVRGGPG